MSKVVVISSSLRHRSNSEALAQQFTNGAKEAGHDVQFISLRDYPDIAFCRGCLACQKTCECIINDDANKIARLLLEADSICFATPVYYYSMSGQLKTLLDRCNSLYSADYRFRNIYLLCAAAEGEASTPEKTITTLQGWIDCFEKAHLCGSVFAGGVNDPGEISSEHQAMQRAYILGKGCK